MTRPCTIPIPEVSIVVPAYNEFRDICPTWGPHEAMRTQPLSYELDCRQDDGSTDGAKARCLRELVEQHLCVPSSAR